MVELPITIGSSPIERTMILDFVVVNEEGPYQMILGRPFLRMSKAVLSNHYLALKYGVNGVVGVVRGDQRIARNCYSSAAREAMQITSLDTRVEAKNGRQFDNQSFRDFCQNLRIELKYCSPARPQSNGQVEAPNKTIKRLLKTRLGAKNGAWVEELSGVLRAYRTTHKTATGETPFALAFGHEAVVPVEIGTTTHRTDHFDEKENNDQMCLNLDLLTEKREQASKRAAIYQQRIARYYNQKVNVR